MRLLIGIAALFGVAFVFLTPPLQVPDEAAHYWRACAIAHGVFQPTPRFGHGFTAIPAGERELGVRGGRPLSEFRSIPYVSERVVVRYPLFYSALPFVPQALAIAIGDTLHLRPLIAFYLGRLLNLAAALSLIALAFRLFASPVLATCALLPMTLFLFASFSSDATTIAMTFLATALALAGSPWIIVASLALGLCEPAYVLIPLVVLASRRRWFAATTVVAVIAGAFLSASFVKTDLGFLKAGVDSRAQIAFVSHHPFHVTATIARDFVQHAGIYATEMVGGLGWLTVSLPMIVTIFVFVTLVLSSVARVTRAQRVLAIGVAVATIFIIELSQYIAWTPVGASIVEGVQGRYFVPIAPLLLIAISRRSFEVRGLPIAMAAANAVALFALWQHYFAA